MTIIKWLKNKKYALNKEDYLYFKLKFFFFLFPVSKIIISWGLLLFFVVVHKREIHNKYFPIDDTIYIYTYNNNNKKEKAKK